MEDQDYILFDQYILEELSLEDTQAFNERLVTNAEFKKSFETYKELTSFLENKFENEAQESAFKDNLKQISKEHFNKKEVVIETQKKSKLFRFSQLAIAASIAILFGVFVFSEFSDPTYNDFNMHDPMDITVRSNNTETITQATEAFNTKDYNKASLYIVDLLKNDPDNADLKLYNAIVNIELDNFIQADKTLRTIAQGKSVYKNRATWYLALSRLKQGAKDTEIIELLNQIPDDADDYEKAQKLLNKLD